MYFYSDIAGRVIHQLIARLDIRFRVDFVQFVLRSELVAGTFHFHCMDEAGNRNKFRLFRTGGIVFGFGHFTSESQFVTLGEEYVKVLVTIGTFA